VAGDDPLLAVNEDGIRETELPDACRDLGNPWGKAGPMAEAIWRLLKSWHRDFYRFGSVDLRALANCIEANMDDLDRFRPRGIASLCKEDEPTVKVLFRAFTDATRQRNKSGSQESTVATAKSLHLLAPGFFPLWDNPIAYHYDSFPMEAGDYVAFSWKMKDRAAAIESYLSPADDRTPLKRIDEFNYAVHTKNWVKVG
jgi:hypothetical protein